MVEIPVWLLVCLVVLAIPAAFWLMLFAATVVVFAVVIAFSFFAERLSR